MTPNIQSEPYPVRLVSCSTDGTAGCSIDYFSLVTVSGKAYMWNPMNDEDEAESDSEEDYDQIEYNSFPVPLTLPHPIRSISLGGMCILALTVSGQVYACGYNTEGSLGIPGHWSHSKLVSVPAPEPMKDAMVTDFYSQMALGISGNVYVWGNNLFNHLGLEDKTTRVTMEKRPLPERIIGITRSVFANMAISASGQIYQWGRANPFRKIITRSGNYFPEPIRFMHKQVIITVSGKFCIREKGRYRKVGTDASESCHHPFIEFPERIRMISSSRGEHNLAVGISGRIYAWGFNDVGQLGLGDKVNRKGPELVKEL
jgi:alpha-tubulin suppressor-like RCC1 family protein